MRVRLGPSRPASVAVREFISRMAPPKSPALLVRRRELPYWVERGWIRSGDDKRATYSGNYQTPHGAFLGTAEQRGPGYFRFFIYDPPEVLQGNGHWTCFMDRGNGWYEVHMGRQPADISSGVMTIERLISEAFDA